jgi:hypothetical protein
MNLNHNIYVYSYYIYIYSYYIYRVYAREYPNQIWLDMVQCLHLRILKFPQPHHSSPLHRSSFPVPHVLHCFKWCLNPWLFPGSRGPASSVKSQPQSHRCFQGNSGHPANPTCGKRRQKKQVGLIVLRGSG